ncbi:MAG TPA: LysR substrate-binding domain-containing protein [Rhodanobacteraceae bacterium]
MIGISPRQLEVFVAIATSGSVRAAAEHLHLTQPAASMALAELERHLDARLFERDRGRLHLNDRGRGLLPLAQEVLDRLREVERQGGKAPHELVGDLRLGASNTVGNYLVGDLLGAFAQAHPHVSVHLTVGNTRAIVAAVHAHALDVGCVEGPVTQPDLDVLPWRDDALVVCAPTTHALTRHVRLKPAHFAQVRWIFREPGSATRASTERILASLPPGEIVMELGQIEAIKQAVIAGLGVAMLPAVAVRDAVAAGRLKVLDTPFLDLDRRLSLVLSRDKYRSALLAAFLASVQD